MAPGRAEGGRAADRQVADGVAQLVDRAALDEDQLAGQPALVDQADDTVPPLDGGR